MCVCVMYTQPRKAYTMIKVNELFAGIGAFRKALQRQGIPHEIVGISEIDKYAIKSYEAIYGATIETRIDKRREGDILPKNIDF